jgi:L-asparaginase II
LADADGTTMLAIGDVTMPVFPRSAIKALQALALVEHGAADRYGFGDEELALACASHSGEPGHVAGVERMLARAGLDSSALRCGAHYPISQAAAAALARTGAPSALHNNCSGKHAGFLCLACALEGDSGIDHAEYFRPEHPVQHEVRAVLEDFTGAALGESVAPSTVARCRLGRCRSKTLLAVLLNSPPAAAFRPRAPRPPHGCAKPARASRGMSPAPVGSAPRSCGCSARACS